MMFRPTISIIVVLAYFCLYTFADEYANTKPLSLPEVQFDSLKATKLAEKMLVAHGKDTQWLQDKTLSFTHSLYILNFPKDLNPWWISDEQHQYNTRRGYHFYPMEDSLLVFKNGLTFFQNWIMPNPPGMMPFFNYNFVIMPWLIKQNGAIVSYSGKRKLPHKEGEYETLKLQFVAAATQTPNDYFRLFIDPTGLLKGVEYNGTYAPMLDKMQIKGDQFGPGFHVYDNYQRIDDLLFPQRYSTYFSDKLAGVHAISRLSLDKKFNEELAHRLGELHPVTAHPTKRFLTTEKVN
jgi:hypothetical protein